MSAHPFSPRSGAIKTFRTRRKSKKKCNITMIYNGVSYLNLWPPDFIQDLYKILTPLNLFGMRVQMFLQIKTTFIQYVIEPTSRSIYYTYLTLLLTLHTISLKRTFRFRDRILNNNIRSKWPFVGSFYPGGFKF